LPDPDNPVIAVLLPIASLSSNGPASSLRSFLQQAPVTSNVSVLQVSVITLFDDPACALYEG